MKHTFSFLQRSFKIFIMVILALTSFSVSSYSQKGGRCKVDQVYFVESGQMIIDVAPSAQAGYQLNILGAGADNFEVIQEPFMSALYVIPGYTNATSAKWQVNFAIGFERILCSIKMKNKCTGETLMYPLTVGVKLLNR